jgi:hypothetical protein
MNTKTQRRQLKNFDKNPIEAIRESGSGAIKTTGTALKNELQLDVTRAWEQLLGKSLKTTQKESYELQEGEEVDFSKKEKKVQIAPAIDYFAEIIHSEKRISAEQNRELSAKIEEIRIEITKLAKSSKQLEMVVKDVSIEKIGPNPGKYHLNFFEWVFASIQTARIRVEESTSWLSIVSTKSRKKDYWSLSKKHGTSYMLSGERVVAQQTG